MKKTIYLCVALLLFSTPWGAANAQTSKLKGTISISGAFALYPLAAKWAAEFKKINPNVNINLSACGSGKGMSDVLTKSADIGMLSRDVTTTESSKGAYVIDVACDAVVMFVNSSNPQLSDILAHGINKSAASNVFITGRYTTWGQATGIKSNVPIRIYSRMDASGDGDVWAKYFGKKQEDLLGVSVSGAPGLVQAVKKDPLGIGYCSIGYAYDAITKQVNPGIKILGIDLNSNGKIDADENFYNTLNDLLKAITSGKYPTPPARDLYFVTNGKPSNPIVQEFIKFVLTDGQKFVSDTGYVGFAKSKLDKELLKVK